MKKKIKTTSIAAESSPSNEKFTHDVKSDYPLVEKPNVINRKYNIQRTIEEQRQEREAQKNLSKEKTEFDQDQFEKAWKQATTLFEKSHQDAAILSATLQDSKPIIIDNYKIIVELPSKIMCKELDAQKSYLLVPLRNLLKNDYIELETKLSAKAEKQVDKNKPEEVFKTMLNENPLLAQLIKKLDLEITDE